MSESMEIASVNADSVALAWLLTRTRTEAQALNSRVLKCQVFRMGCSSKRDPDSCKVNSPVGQGQAMLAGRKGIEGAKVRVM